MAARTSKQFTVWLENKPGQLAKLGKTLQRAKVNIVALSVDDSVDSGQVRFVADNAAQARQALTGAKLAFSARDVLVLQLENMPGAMGKVGADLAKAKINVDYVYGSTHPKQPDAIVVVACGDTAAARKLLG